MHVTALTLVTTLHLLDLCRPAVRLAHRRCPLPLPKGPVGKPRTYSEESLLALVQPWGRMLPRRLLLVLAWVASVGLVLWGLGYFYLRYFLAVGRVVSAPEFAAQDAHPAAGWGFYWYAVFLAWGIALGAAAWWSRRTRPGTPRGTRDG